MIRIIKVMIITNLTRQMSIIFAAPYWYKPHLHNWEIAKPAEPVNGNGAYSIFLYLIVCCFYTGITSKM